MSENWLRLIPADPRYIPSPEAQEQARRALAWLAPRAAKVRATAAPHVRFIDPGANLAQIRCPACGVDVAGWRRLAMDRARLAPSSAGAESGFGSQGMTMPCCGAATSLHDLAYDWPAGVARFALEARDPEVRDLTGAQVAALEQLLGCRLRRIWTHI
jgi:hypothetical protein